MEFLKEMKIWEKNLWHLKIFFKVKILAPLWNCDERQKIKMEKTPQKKTRFKMFFKAPPGKAPQKR